ncbi:lipid II:glycine glycyltransferase FemX [Patescibacteria group bacterium]
MKVEAIDPKINQLSNFIESQKHSTYLQSWQWGEFHKIQGRKVKRRAWLADNEIVAVASAITRPLPAAMGYWYLPKGPVVADDYLNNKELWQDITDWVKENVKENNLLFAQIEPATDNKELANLLKDSKWRSAPSIEPPDTQLLDLSLTDDALLKALHHKTRYNIRLAQRKGVIVEHHGPEKLNEFFRLVEITNKREQITSFPKSYYELMIKALGEKAKIVIGNYQKQAIVANLLITYGDTATYAHGASANEHRNVMAPHLVQWESIIWAKKNGYRYYDFRGIAPTDEANHKWAGITRFKKSFGGRSVHHLGAYDLVNKRFWYRLYRFYRRG